MSNHCLGYSEQRQDARPRVLVVDDHWGVHESVRVILEDRYEVLGAFDGQEAVNVINSCKVDLVLLDLLMPGMDGMQVLTYVKEAKPHIPIIVVTAVRDVRTVMDTVRLGATDYLTKPFNDAELLPAIQRTLAGHSHDSHVPAQPNEPARDPHVQRAHVLCVGNDLGLLATLKLVLKRYCETDVVTDTMLALHLFSNDPPSMLLMQSSLPLPDGILFLRLMRSRFPTCPVILISEDDSTLLLSQEFCSLPTYTRIAEPHRFNELLRGIASLHSPTGLASSLSPTLSYHIAKAVCYIGAHYARALTVKRVGNAIGLSEGYLAHLFPVELGLTVRGFIMGVRIEVAKQLLCNRRYTLEHIAEMVGFCDASHLSRVFRQFSGRRPGLYRREIANS